MPQSLLQPAPFRTPFFAKDGQIHEEWRRFFLSNQTLVNLLLQQLIAGTPHPSLVSAEDSDPSDPFIVPGPTGPAGGAGPQGKPGFDGEDGIGLFEPMLHGPQGPLFPTFVASTASGALNDFAPGLFGPITLVQLTGAAPALTGLAGGSIGQIVIFKNLGVGVATFAQNSGSSTAGNRFQNIITSAPTPIAPAGFIVYQYNGTIWQLVGHSQGATIAWTPTDQSGAGLVFGFAAGTYVVDGIFVKIDFQVNYPVTTDASNILFGGLPFAAVPNCGLSMGEFGNGAALSVYGIVNGGASTIQFVVQGTNARVTNSQLSAGFCVASGTYSAG